MPAGDDRIDALYSLPLERFVQERDALSKVLRAERNRAGADEVRRLPKPTRAAWAVNIAVREQREVARALADSARLLREAQQELLAGGDASALHAAGERTRAAVEALAAAAPAAGETTAAKVRATLHAATVDPDVLAAVTAGRVTREHVASGFGGLTAAGSPRKDSRAQVRKAGASAGTPKRGGERGGAAVRERPERRATAREQAREAREQAARAAAARNEERKREKVRRAKEEEAAAEHGVTAARRALEQVESVLVERRAQLRDADSRLKGARRRRERAER